MDIEDVDSGVTGVLWGQCSEVFGVGFEEIVDEDGVVEDP